MRSLQRDASRFARHRQEKATEAGQRVALRLLCGLDLEDVMAAGSQEKLRLIERVDRLLERERLRGLRRHWSYDLNRHIALKQARDRLREMKG
ncbi:cytoplasmic protein [Aquamicrobium ahrensii]|uniref:Cytoplasmic protein n=1 Tax=Aquamicrobium ahrensii TaxID=469551 RepID=A0ABV2KR61_9HYPH